MAGTTSGIYAPLQWGAAPQTDYASMLMPTISQPGINIPTEAASGWGNGMMGWLDNSGILGKTLADGTQMQGWGGMALGAASGLMNSFLGFQQLKLAKDAAGQSRRQFDMNFGAQAKTINAQLEDQQRARVASNPGAYESVSTYMKKNGIGG